MNTKLNNTHRFMVWALSLTLAAGGSIGAAGSAIAAPHSNGIVATAALPTSTVVSPDGVAEVRSGPGVNHRSVAQLRNGDRVTVLETRSGWSRVGIDQWVASWLLRPGNQTPSTTIWRVQIGASQTKSRAEAIAIAAQEKGFQTFVRHVGTWYRVQVGAYAVKANADAMVTKARAAGFSDAFARAD